ncbi:hypothetical protein HK103_007478 [Boothiomyces macroporosus]|uniref:Uncharacterized protein n=1 Tax=Boothiomyces macroporosus TaxID=261099 RepID=A0AAD5UCJ5_9FUNG|nr:hypothetical protein HK103_007478 [Boothiomyces macroporosus]
MFTLALIASVFADHAGKFSIAGDVTFVPPTDKDTLKSYGIPIDNWGIDYEQTSENNFVYTADSDGGFNFAVKDNAGNFCTFIFDCNPFADTCEIVNHELFHTEKALPSKGLKCETFRQNITELGLEYKDQAVIEQLVIAAFPAF